MPIVLANVLAMLNISHVCANVITDEYVPQLIASNATRSSTIVGGIPTAVGAR